jgi:cytochrome c oxidase cbb3-type subunit 3
MLAKSFRPSGFMLSKKLLLFTGLAMLMSMPALAADKPEPSLFSNPLALTLLFLMGVLLIIIAVLASILVGAADWKLKLSKKKQTAIVKPLTTILLLCTTTLCFAQDAPAADAATQTVKSIGGLPSSTFYVMASVIFLELAIILILLVNIRFLIRAAREKETEAAGIVPVAEKAAKPRKLAVNWWNKLNRFKPVEQEKDIEMEHEYDGIRELDNRLPPWWLWGFYATIIFSVIYLWRYHVSESAPLSEEEYQISLARAEVEVQEYLKKKGEAVNENTVTYLSGADDLAAGAKIYTTSCVACHNAKGEGGVGPNLTDDYWLHGGDIKSIFRTIKYGVDGKGMAAWQSVYSPKELAQVTSYVKSLVGTNPPNGREPQGVIYKEEENVATPDSTQAASASVAGIE